MFVLLTDFFGNSEKNRHCERSEAISPSGRLLRSYIPRNDSTIFRRSLMKPSSTKRKKAITMMKQITAGIILIATTHITIYAQNLVPNPSFETYSSCPFDLSQLSFATSWVSPTAASPDYMNACNSGNCASLNQVDVPNSIFGAQAALTGNAYAGVITYNDPASFPEYREYIQTQLVSNLIAGVTYAVQFYASCAEGPCDPMGLSNGLGAYLSVTAPSSASYMSLPYTPQVFSAGTINSTTTWTLISGTFVAAGGERYITIGNFNDDAATTVGNGPITPTKFAAYYFIDDVSVIAQPSLSIESISFTVKCNSSTTQQLNNSIAIFWSTATETNNDYFTIERSADGVNWEVAGIVDGAGNSSTTRDYEFIDSSPLPFGEGSGEGLYRLKQTDFDGKYEYFDPVAVEACSDFTVFPNPANNKLNIRFFSETEDEIIFEVYDVIGRLIISKTAVVAKGNNLLSLDISSVASGVYMLKCHVTFRDQSFGGQTIGNVVHKKIIKS